MTDKLLTHNCIMCGREFHPASPEIAICPQCGGPPQAMPEEGEGTDTHLDVGMRTQHLEAPIPTLRQKAAPQERELTADQVPLEWQEGDVILDLYEVLGELGKGGMGVVYKVRHRGWDMELAVKSPLQSALDRVGGEGAFIAEAEAWIDLGLHPHIVTCFYVRKLGPVPRLFAEYVQGGSLSQWIEKGKLRDLEGVLDAAIQFAWGLDYAHQQELTHKDVKPANVLMSADGEVKVTDFGQAKAKAGYTPAYCSPEQAAAQLDSTVKLTPATDMWSWALSILEVFAGSTYWVNPAMPLHAWGQLAPQALKSYLAGEVDEPTIARMPESLSELLAECFHEIPDERPEGMDAVAERLVEIYEGEFGRSYPREQPQAVDLKADSLNNRALSLLDLDREEEALEAWQEAMQFTPSHSESNLNLSSHEWRESRITDDEMLNRLNGIQGANLDNASYWYGLTALNVERGNIPSAQENYERAQSLTPEWTFPTGGSGISIERTLEKHKDQVFAVCFLERAGLLASGGSEEEILLWDIEAGRPQSMFKKTGFVTSLASSSDERYLASSSADRTVKIWNLKSRRMLKRLEGHTDVVTDVAFTEDENLLLSSSLDGTVKLWDWAKRRCLRTYEEHEGWVLSVELMPDGQSFLTGSRDQTVRLWDIHTGEIMRIFHREWSQRKAEYGRATSKAGHVLWVGSDGMFLWDLNTGRLLRTFRNFTDTASISPFMDGDLSPDGRIAVSCGQDKEIRFWQVDSGQCIRTEKLARAIECARFISLTDVAAAVGNDVQLWHVDIPPDPRVYQPMLSIPKSASAAQETQDLLDEKLVEVDGLLEASRPAAAQALIREAQAIPGLQHEEQLLQRLAVCGKQGSRYQFREWWLSNSFHLGEFEGLGGVQSVRFSPDSTVLAAGHQEGIVGIFDIIRGQQRTVLSRQIGFVRSLLFLDQETLLSMSHFGDVIWWDLDTGKGERDSGIEVKRSMHLSTVLSEDGSYLVLIGLGGYSLLPIRMSMVSPVRADPYETELTRADPDLDVPAIMDPKGNAGWLYKSAASPDGSLFTTTLLEGSRGGDIHTIYVFKPTEGGVRIESRLLDHTNPVLVMTFAPTSDQLASGDLTGNVKLWDVAAESCIRTLNMPGSQITALAYSSDGQHLLVGDKDGSLFLWDIYGHLLAQNHAHGKKINALAFSPDGRFAASGGFDNTINLWGFDWDYKFPNPAYWDDGARPYLEIFLTLHTPYGSDDISRVGVPTWTEEDFQQLLTKLSYHGYGWLRPEGVRRKLEEMAAQRT